jgi:hypothetical protein
VQTGDYAINLHILGLSNKLPLSPNTPIVSVVISGQTGDSVQVWVTGVLFAVLYLDYAASLGESRYRSAPADDSSAGDGLCN